ncbi:MAG TPA: hypothetical protein VH969_27100 [Actinophytocola sp.]|jgi:hypothetical protein|uniref:hypothetical protein n=1 Tax=Actinophytocola sp. TaxID=1872138 RepID=UPI002F932FF7
MSTGAVVVLVIVVVLALAVGAWFVTQQSRRRRLQERFGPEYDRRVSETDDRRVAERELAEREKRHKSYDLRPLSDADRARYTEQWTLVQEQFVDQPGEAVAAAEQLVVMVMRDRGYPTDNFEQSTADLSVEHAHLVDRFRAGHDIRTRHTQGTASTEELRQALTHFRGMFEALLGHGRTETDDADRAYQAGRADAGTHGVPQTRMTDRHPDAPETAAGPAAAHGQVVEEPRRTKR